MIDQAEVLVDKIKADHPGDEVRVRAYTDPSRAATNRPCVLVSPPTIDFSRRSATWTLAVLASKGTGGRDTWDELDVLVAAVVRRLPVETARPSAYFLTKSVGNVPAYLLTVTTSH